MTLSKTCFRILVATVLVLVSTMVHAVSADPINIGDRLELFIDDYLIGEIEGDVSQQLLPLSDSLFAETGSTR
jgi:hypothetical protein